MANNLEKRLQLQQAPINPSREEIEEVKARGGDYHNLLPRLLGITAIGAATITLIKNADSIYQLVQYIMK